MYQLIGMASLLQSIASHIIKVHASAGATRGETTRVSKEDNWLKRYEPLPNVALSIYGLMLYRLHCMFAGIYNTVELNASPVFLILQPQCCRRVMLKLDRYPSIGSHIVNRKVDRQEALRDPMR